jgi:sigma-70-like protein
MRSATAALYLAHQALPTQHRWADLRQTARTGLIAAVDRCDPAYGTPFVPYAVARVVGELKRHLRDTSWRLHVPRPLKEQALQLCRAADELHQRWGRSPTTLELAAQLEVGEEEVLEALAATSSRQEVSLDQPIGGDDADLQLSDLMAAPGVREEPRGPVGPALPGGRAAGVGKPGHRSAVLPGPRPARNRGQGQLLPDAHFPPAAPALARMRAQLVEPWMSESGVAMQVIWMLVITLALAFSGVLGLTLVTHLTAWTKRRRSHH